MKIMRLALLLGVLLALLIPTAVMASWNVYYCSYDAVDGSGTYNDPWACSTAQEKADIVDWICGDGGGILYQIVEDGYWRHVIEWTGKGACGITASYWYYGYPPSTGVSMSPPLVFGGALTIGLGLFAVGMVVYRKQFAN